MATLALPTSISIKRIVPKRDSRNFHHGLAGIGHFVANHQSFCLPIVSGIKRSRNRFIRWPDFNGGNNFAGVCNQAKFDAAAMDFGIQQQIFGAAQFLFCKS